jgi:hypothetical protein
MFPKEIAILTCVLHVKVVLFPKSSILIFSVRAIYSFVEDRYWKPSFSGDMEYHASSFFKKNMKRGSWKFFMPCNSPVEVSSPATGAFLEAKMAFAELL